MKRVIALAAAAGLCGCTMWSSTIRHDVVDYTDVLETTSNQLLLVNVLQARDGAPLHFAAIPNIHGSLAGSVAVAGTDSFPLGTEGHVIVGNGAHNVGTPGAGFLNGAVNPTLTVSDSPSFEVDSVETKDFVTGISSPIDAKFVKYWLDRGLDKRIILLMFFRSAEITEKIYAHDANNRYIWLKKKDPQAPEICGHGKRHKQVCHSRTAVTVSAEDDAKKKEAPCDPALKEKEKEKKCTRKVLGTQTITVYNDPRSAANELEQCWQEEKHPRSYYLERNAAGMLRDTDCHARTQFEHYLTLVDKIKKGITANSYSERTTLSGPLKIDLTKQLKDVAKLDTKKYTLEFRSDGTYMLYSTSDDANVALCFNRSFATGDAARSGDAKDDCTKSVTTNDPVDLDDKGTLDYPVDPDLSPSSSGNCTKPGPSANAPDLDYCTIFQRFYCHTDESENVDEKGGDKKKVSGPRTAAEAEVNNPVVEYDPADGCGPWPDGTFSLQFNGRSAAEMVRFLGDLLHYQDVMQGPDKHHNIPLTPGWWDESDAAKGEVDIHAFGGRGDCALLDGGCLFQVTGGLFNVAPDVKGERVHVIYRDNPYSVGDYRADDHSLEVLSMLNQLINLNKSATDLRTTPTVQLVP